MLLHPPWLGDPLEVSVLILAQAPGAAPVAGWFSAAVLGLPKCAGQMPLLSGMAVGNLCSALLCAGAGGLGPTEVLEAMRGSTALGKETGLAAGPCDACPGVFLLLWMAEHGLALLFPALP